MNAKFIDRIFIDRKFQKNLKICSKPSPLETLYLASKIKFKKKTPKNNKITIFTKKNLSKNAIFCSIKFILFLIKWRFIKRRCLLKSMISCAHIKTHWQKWHHLKRHKKLNKLYDKFLIRELYVSLSFL